MPRVRPRIQGTTPAHARLLGAAHGHDRDGVVRPEDLPQEVGGVSAPGASELTWDPTDDFQTAKQKIVERFERDILTTALEKHSGNISKAARSLGLHRQNLQQKLRQLEISAEDFRT